MAGDISLPSSLPPTGLPACSGFVVSVVVSVDHFVFICIVQEQRGGSPGVSCDRAG